MSNVVIESGGINPVKAKVRAEGQFETFGVAVEEFENVSARDSLSFTWTSVPYNSANGDTQLLVQNISDTLLLHILEIRILVDTSSACVVFTIDAATTPVGTEVVGRCWNRAAPKVAPAAAVSDDTANTAQETIFFNEEVLADTLKVLDLHGALILGKNAAIGWDLAAGSTLSAGQISGFFAINDALRV